MVALFQTYIFAIIWIALYMTGWFFISILRKRNDVADTAWGIGFFLVALTPLLIHGLYTIQQGLVTLLVLIWGSRLSYHIHKRNKKKGEDPRYLAWRQSWKWFYTRSFFQIYVLQGFLMLLIVTPVLFINTFATAYASLWLPVGFVVWMIGFTFEYLGDKQLKEFLADPDNKGKIMDQALWAYTRHPNYFGEVTQWWGIFLIALSVPYGIFSIIGPLTITFLILKVSGVPMLEKGFAGKLGWEEYKKKTSVFIPWVRG